MVGEEMWKTLKTGAGILVQPSPGGDMSTLRLGLGLALGLELGVGVPLTLILTLNQILVVILTNIQDYPKSLVRGHVELNHPLNLAHAKQACWTREILPVPPGRYLLHTYTF